MDKFTAVQNGKFTGSIKQTKLNTITYFTALNHCILDHITSSQWSVSSVTVILYPVPTENTTLIHNCQSSWHVPLINKIITKYTTYKRVKFSAITNY